MKKIVLIGLCVLMISTLCGCGGGKEKGEEMVVNFAGEEKKAELILEDVKSGTGEKIGTYGYIDVSEKTLEDIDTKALRSFIVANESSFSELNWFTIVLKDGKGISFPGNSLIVGRYGTVDSDKTVVQEKVLMLVEGEDYKIEDL